VATVSKPCPYSKTSSEPLKVVKKPLKYRQKKLPKGWVYQENKPMKHLEEESLLALGGPGQTMTHGQVWQLKGGHHHPHPYQRAMS
jgi:hypothetical protein